MQAGVEGFKNAHGKDHIAFFDKCAALGLKVIAPIIPNNPQGLVDDPNKLQKVQFLIDEIGNHSALMAWYIGSDWGLEDPSASSLLDAVNSVLDYVRNHSKVPISHCVSDIATSASTLISRLRWDYVCANAGWDGSVGLANFLGVSNGTQSASGWASLAKQRGLPILIGQAGWAGMNSSFLQANQHAFGDMLLNVLNMDQYGVVGQVYRSYMDQPTHPDSWERTLGLVTPSVAVSGLNNSTQPDVFWADDVSPKDIIYASVSSGTTSTGRNVNYKADLFSIMGRQPRTMTPSGKTNPASSASLHLPSLTFPVIFTMTLVFDLFI